MVAGRARGPRDLASESTVAPIVSIAGEDARLSALRQHLAAIAIMFDFVNLVLAFWRLIDRGRKLRRDKAQAGNAGHGCYLAVLDRKLRVLPCEARNRPRSAAREEVLCAWASLVLCMHHPARKKPRHTQAGASR